MSGMNGRPGAPKNTAVGWGLAYAAVVLAMVTSAAFGALSFVALPTFLALVGAQNAPVGAGAQIMAAYTGARELAIAVTLVVILLMRTRRWLAPVMLLAGLANLFDGAHALLTQRWVQAPGAIVVALIYLAAALWISRRANEQEIG